MASQTLLYACRTCGNDDVHAPPPRRRTEARLVRPREFFPSHLSLSTLSPPFFFFAICRARQGESSPVSDRGCPSQVLNDATAAGRPALGPSFTFMSDATLWLGRPLGQDRELRIAEVLRSRIWVCACPYFSSCVDVLLRQDDRVALRVSYKTRNGAASLGLGIHTRHLISHNLLYDIHPHTLSLPSTKQWCTSPVSRKLPLCRKSKSSCLMRVLPSQCRTR
jgi:hypothetical protein